MLKKYVKHSLLYGLVIVGFSSCQSSTTPKSEEAHNPATQTVPQEAEHLIGRWDLTVDRDGKTAPSWLEVKLSGYNTLVGSFVGESGSSRPVSHVKLENGRFSFAIPPQWEGGEGDFVIEGELTEAGLKGTIKSNKGIVSNYSGVKAPYLNRTGEAKWGTAIELFNGKDLSGWRTSSDDNQWVVKEGVLVNQKAGANLITEQKFEDFKLIAEFRYTEGGNSGIYLRGRYEVQIEDSPKDRHPGSLYFGGVYGFLSPNEMATLGPNTWNRYEITLRGRLVTIVANGKTIIANQEIPGITGGALDSQEGEPGPIYLQGDHTGVEFRKLTIIPAG
ncbi:3-keto-disaccharide hydrolase [Sphingobacterium sp. LRF_L2]|uniref:3-keto-disaccharide hydrolase n=1 Tax=Sphingobacterium sp. LRF_L2 TaxID=3369421 RepID=UPI003F5DF008